MSSAPQTFGVVGRHGAFEALCDICQRADNVSLVCWDPEPGSPLPDHVTQTDDVAALADVPLIFFCAPMIDARAVARRLGDVITGQHLIVHTSRALEVGTRATVSEILRDETATHRVGLLTGPMRGEDVAAGLGASGLVSSSFPEIHEFLEDALVSPLFRLYRSEDLVGAEIAAIYTRALAFVHGLSLGMARGASTNATIFARGLAEISRMVVYRGGYERTVFGLSGAGNLYADTTAEPGSVDVRIGMRCVTAGRFDKEAIIAEFGTPAARLIDLVRAMASQATEAGVEASIVRAAHALMSGDLSTADAARHLMTLPVLDE